MRGVTNIECLLCKAGISALPGLSQEGENRKPHQRFSSAKVSGPHLGGLSVSSSLPEERLKTLIEVKDSGEDSCQSSCPGAPWQIMHESRKEKE